MFKLFEILLIAGLQIQRTTACTRCTHPPVFRRTHNTVNRRRNKRYVEGMLAATNIAWSRRTQIECEIMLILKTIFLKIRSYKRGGRVFWFDVDCWLRCQHVRFQFINLIIWCALATLTYLPSEMQKCSCSVTHIDIALRTTCSLTNASDSSIVSSSRRKCLFSNIARTLRLLGSLSNILRWIDPKAKMQMWVSFPKCRRCKKAN